MGNPEQLDPKSQKIHHNWSRQKRFKSQVNGRTEISLHNKILRSEAKARQF